MHFALDLATDKTKIWATEKASADRVADRFGLTTTNVLSALGAQWPVNKEAKPTFSKELERIRQAEKRMLRLKHLPSPFGDQTRTSI